MKFTRNWLQNYVDIAGLSTEKLADHLTMLGLEVDSVEPLFPDLSQLKTGYVTIAEKHPDADKLTVCQVQIGNETHQIVCGAPNVRQGLAVVVALPGTVLPGDFKIKASKIRGVASGGMICSEKELGLSNDHNGIMELPEGTEHGQPFLTAMGLDDIFIEVDLTPNRPDCTSVIGIAREIGGVTGTQIHLPLDNAAITSTSTDFDVEIENPELCPRYSARLIQNVTIAPSPWWLRRQLLSVGLRPINNVVDITNFVMLEYGQPLHAFDFNTLAGAKIVVRTPRKNEATFTTLDNSERKLDDDMLLICDGEKPVALAGIMGGLNSEVTDSTTSILLESACFNPVSIRKTARRVNLSTDASYRFERGVDPNVTINALNRATELICELGGGSAENNGVDRNPGKKPLAVFDLRVAKTNDLIGITLQADEIARLLSGIGFLCSIESANLIKVTAPSFRVDIEREADLIEEVARLYGYDNIPTTLPTVNLSYPEQDTRRKRRLGLAEKLCEFGFTEAINYSFIGEKHCAMLGLSETDPRCTSVKLLNPLSEDQAVLRTMLLPGLLENVRRNINFQKTSIKLFEIGKVFTPLATEKLPQETMHIAGVLSGKRYGDSSPFHFSQSLVDIYDAKGAVEFISEVLGISIQAISDREASLSFTIPTDKELEPFIAKGYALLLKSGDNMVGSLGKIKSDILKQFAIKNEVYYFNLDFDALCMVQTESVNFTALPVFPSVKRDIALVVADNVSAGELLSAVRNSPEKLIESCEIFDVFKGDKIPQGQKSIALTITYRSQTKTLTEKNVEKSHSKIVRLLTDQFGGSFRNA